MSHWCSHLKACACLPGLPYANDTERQDGSAVGIGRHLAITQKKVVDRHPEAAHG